MDKLIMVEPAKQIIKVFGEGIVLAIALFELIEKLPKEHQKTLIIVSIILVALYIDKRIDQLDTEKEDELTTKIL